MFAAIIIGLLVVCIAIAAYFDYTRDYADEKIEYRRQKRILRAKRKKQKYKEKLEGYRLSLEENGAEQPQKLIEQQTEDVKKDDYYDFLELAHKQMERFALYSCKNDDALQELLDKTFLSISKLTAKLNTDNYTTPAIIQFYQVELEQFFILLGKGPTFTVNKKLYEKLQKCLDSIGEKADKLGIDIKEWQEFTIDVKFDALIEYIDN